VTAPSPALRDASLVTFTIKAGGKAIPTPFQVDSIDTWTAVNRVSKAQLVIFDGSPAEADFEISDLDTFLPGKTIDIAAGYEGLETSIFRGVVVKQGLEIDRTRGSKLIVDVTDEAIKMTLERKNAVFEKIKDSDLIGKLITQSGLEKDVGATNTVHEEIVQYYASDWDLMVTRAEMNGLVVTVEGGKVTVEKPDTAQSPVLKITYGESILDLSAEMDAASQFASAAIQSFAWDSATQKLVQSGPGSVAVKEAGNVSSAELAKVFNVKKFTQQSAGAVEKSALQDWSSAELLKSKLSKIRGSVRFQGSARASTGKVIELAGVGKRFTGPVFVSAVHHRIHDGQWLTTAQFGLSPKWFAAETRNIEAPPAAGQLPAVSGLQSGVVKKVAKDPGGEFRVLVSLPLLQAGSKGVWARVASFYTAAGKGGAVFFPEIDDEVVVAFLNDDPRYPVVLGGLYSKKLPPPYPPNEGNDKKAIVTRSQLEISFDDKDKILEIRTPGKHVVKLDDKTGALSIQDNGNKNQISLSKGGITIDSGSNLKLNAKGNITVTAGGNLTLTAKANANLEGLQVNAKAKGKLSAKSSGLAELSAGGILTVKGALVKIN
jgi:Rhs element Vgr protein